MTQPPEWLADFQARFSAMLRAPLDRSSGTLRSEAGRYPAALCAEALSGHGLSGAERLATYNRQYWFRLFTMLQTEYPLVVALLGAWSFNALAARFLEQQPPRHHDLARDADGFADFLERELPSSGLSTGRERRSVPTLAIVQAARIDDAYRVVFRAPEQPPFVPSARDAERMIGARLRWSLAVRRVEEDWPLLSLRRSALSAERALELPPPHDGRRHAMVSRSPEGYRVVPLEPGAAALMQLLESRTLGAALAELEQASAQGAGAELATHTQRWLADGVRLGFWTGLDV